MNYPKISVVFVLIILFTSCGGEKDNVGNEIETTGDEIFQPRYKKHTGIDFFNKFTETVDNSMHRFMYTIIGCGIGVGDFNNDGLPDLYYGGGEVPNKLYLNKGNLKFEDISASAGVDDNIGKTSGVSIVDINGDGFDDIYICKHGLVTKDLRVNQLYINNGDLTFTESAASYGLDLHTLSTQANFFDYDLDGDLDLYLLNYPAAFNIVNQMNLFEAIEKGVNQSDMLFRNNGDNTFTDVSDKAGINNEGHGLSSAIFDFNNDGWPDVYVANDLISPDFLYINNKDGTFTDRIGEITKKSSRFSMGTDVADINEDGLLDMITADIDYLTHDRRQNFRFGATVASFETEKKSGYHVQTPRNTVQLNDGDGTFTEASFYMGLNSSNWSWSPLVMDFDNDGSTDIFMSNGFVKSFSFDVRSQHLELRKAARKEDEETFHELLKELDLRSDSYPNIFFKRKDNMRFEKVMSEGGAVPTISYGAVSVDLDNDGDLDIALNDFLDPVFIYENTMQQSADRSFISVKLEEESLNTHSIGSTVHLYQVGKEQIRRCVAVRGYLSSSDIRMHFGLGGLPIDSIVVEWTDGRMSTHTDVEPNQFVVIKKEESELYKRPGKKAEDPLYVNASKRFSPLFRHKENEFADFTVEHLCMKRLSDIGPGIAVGDLNNDGRDDVVIGSSVKTVMGIYFQNKDGGFERGRGVRLPSGSEIVSPFITDLNNDGWNDIILVAGGVEFKSNEPEYENQVMLNDKSGGFVLDQNLFSNARRSSSCIVANDIDGDGFDELFIGTRFAPDTYPLSKKSQLLFLEDGKYIDVISEVIPDFEHGMICSALFTDFNGDDKKDLITVGEWMDINFYLQTDNGKFEPWNNRTQLGSLAGWWNSIVGGDFDSDGDIDYVVGNFGLNSRYHPTKEEPLMIHYGPYNEDGSKSFLVSYVDHGNRYPVHPLRWMREKFPQLMDEYETYEDLVNQSPETIFGIETYEASENMEANILSSIYLENLGDGTFNKRELPWRAQLFPIKGMVVADINEDGNLDVVIHGNNYGMSPSFNIQDNGEGLVLLGNGKGDFTSLQSKDSGFSSDVDGRALVTAQTGESSVVIGSANNDRIFAYEIQGQKVVRIPDDAAYVLISLKDGKVRKCERYNGSGYLSQSSNLIVVHDRIESIKFIYPNGNEVLAKL